MAENRLNKYIWVFRFGALFMILCLVAAILNEVLLFTEGASVEVIPMLDTKTAVLVTVVEIGLVVAFLLCGCQILNRLRAEHICKHFT